MRHSSSSGSYLVYFGLLCVTFLLFLTPENQVESWRAQAYSQMSPVLKICRVTHQNTEPASIQTHTLTKEASYSQPPVPTGNTSEDLVARVDWLTNENIFLRDALSRLRQSAALPGVKYEIPRGIKAEVIARKLIWQEPFLALDRGEADGVQLNAGVLHRGAVIGRIVAVAKNASSMALLIHPGLKISARLSECRMEGILRGDRDETGEQLCSLSVIGKEVPARVGEHVITNGYDGAFPVGLWLGDVLEVKKSGDVQWEVIVRPACNENQVESVEIINQKNPEVPWPKVQGRREKIVKNKEITK
jgi:rod shape-determining protein MreC